MRNPLERFFSYVSRNESGCWIWAGPLKWSGYGRFNLMQDSFPAHRWYFELIKGPVPEGLVLDHLCRERKCVNPEHLEVVTHKVNILRGSGASARCAAKTHCDKGHVLSGDNLYPPELRKGKRCCATCIRERDRLNYHTNKTAILEQRRVYYQQNRETILARRKEKGADATQR